ncbi:MAG: hypothetical protein JNK67_08030 [Alphaproteobacteria bacterium]|nr:hypothetical protein [Alphaproteobacteria bacterium]
MTRDGTSSSAPRLVRELYFPTYVFYRDLESAPALNPALAGAIRDLRRADPDGLVRSNMKPAGSWHSALDLQSRAPFAPLAAEVLATSRAVAEDLGFDPARELVLDNMWAIVNPRHGSNRGHTHPRVLLSGCYYVQAPPGCGRICFVDPRPQAQVLPPWLSVAGRAQPHNWSEVAFDAIAGRMILFPAWLGHEVEPNLTALEGEASERIVIAFNLYQRPPATPAADRPPSP